MDGTNIDHFAHITLHTLPENSPCPTYIDLIELRTGSGRDRDDTGAVNHTGTTVGIREEVCQRVFRTHITDDGMDFFGEQIDIGVIMQHKRMHSCAAAYQRFYNSSAKEAGSACNKVFIIHSKSLLSQISIQVLIIFHKYSILERKGRNKQHLPYDRKKNNTFCQSVAFLCKLFWRSSIWRRWMQGNAIRKWCSSSLF